MIYGETVVLFWTKARTETLKRRWKDGIIARRIAEELGCSRSAVIGKAYRLKLESRNTGSAAAKKVLANVRLAPTPKDELTPLVPSLLQLEPNHCKFPIGDHYCGRERKDKKPYCEAHLARVFIAPYKPVKEPRP